MRLTLLLTTLWGMITVVQSPLAAQELSVKELQQYPPEVVNRVYDVYLVNKISAAKQIALANFFLKQDKLIAASILANASQDSVRKLRSLLSEELQTKFKEIKPNSSTEGSEDAVAFINAKIDDLNSIKPLSSSLKRNIVSSFMDNYSHAETNNINLGSFFRKMIVGVLPDTAYYAFLFKEQIHLQAVDFARNYAKTRGFPETTGKLIMKHIEPIVYERQKQLRAIDYLYPFPCKEKDEMRAAVIKKYQNNIVKFQLMYDFGLPRSWFSTVYLNRTDLNLNDAQKEELLNLLMDIKVNDFKNNFEKSNLNISFPDFEIKTLKKILNAPQFTSFLKLKNSNRVSEWAIKQWEEIKQREINSGLDSSKVIAQLYSYQMARAIAFDTLREDKQKQTLTIRSVESNKPAALRRLETARKNKESNAVIKNSFVW